MTTKGKFIGIAWAGLDKKFVSPAIEGLERINSRLRDKTLLRDSGIVLVLLCPRSGNKSRVCSTNDLVTVRTNT